MYKDLLRSITGIEIFPVISLCVFVAVFGLIVVRAWRLDSRRVSRMSRLPLDDRTPDDNQKEVML